MQGLFSQLQPQVPERLKGNVVPFQPEMEQTGAVAPKSPLDKIVQLYELLHDMLIPHIHRLV